MLPALCLSFHVVQDFLDEVQLHRDTIYLDSGARAVEESRLTGWQSDIGATFIYSGKEMMPQQRRAVVQPLQLSHKSLNTQGEAALSVASLDSRSRTPAAESEAGCSSGSSSSGGDGGSSGISGSGGSSSGKVHDLGSISSGRHSISSGLDACGMTPAVAAVSRLFVSLDCA